MKERTTLARRDNTVGLWRKQKGSATCTSAPAHLLRLQAMHQRFHRYVPCVDFVSGFDNLISDRPSRSADLTDNQLLTYLETNFPQPLPWRLWNPSPKLSWKNPQGTVNNSELELAGGVVHSDCVAQCFVVKEQTTLARTDNTAGLWRQRKGSATCTSAPAHLLRLH